MAQRGFQHITAALIVRKVNWVPGNGDLVPIASGLDISRRTRKSSARQTPFHVRHRLRVDTLFENDFRSPAVTVQVRSA